MLDLIRRDLGLPSRREWLERLATREPVEGGDIAEEIRAARAERDAQIDAALGGGPTVPVVIDASALVELLLQREKAPAVVQAVGDSQMVAPDVINPEILWALRRRERNGNLEVDRARQAVEDLLDAPVRRFPTLELLPTVWKLRANVTSYDACYVALARELAARWSPPTASCSGRPGWASPCSRSSW